MGSVFKDLAGREWEIVPNVASFKRVRELTPVDLAGIADGSLLATLDSDLVLASQVVYAMCKPVADSRNVSEDDFLSSIDADVGEPMSEALLREIVNFSRKDLRPTLTRILDGAKAMREQAMPMLNQGVDQSIEKMRAELKKSGDLSGAAQEFAESTPETSPSAS